MKITVKKAASGAYTLTFDGHEIVLEEAGLRDLLKQITIVLTPEGGLGKGVMERSRVFLRRIKGANDVGIQKLLRIADEEDILVLLKIAEDDGAVLKKIYGNMSERMRKMFVEDMVFKFKEGIHESEIYLSLGRLMSMVRELVEEGTMAFEGVAKPKAAGGGRKK